MRKVGGAALLALMCLAAQAAWGQVTIGDNVNLNLNGNVAFGYAGSFSSTAGAINTNQFTFGGDLDLNGYYYHPQFLSFHVNPYYNQSRLNSNYQSIFSAKGVNANANLFSGSHTPVSLSYTNDYNNQGQFSIPGSANVETFGRSQSFGVNAGEYYEGLPSLTVGYNVNNNSYDVVGTESGGSGSGRAFNLGSSYILEGFNLGANYSNSSSTQRFPSVANLNDSLEQTTHQNNFQVSASRALGFDSANWNAVYSRSNFTTDITGPPTNQSYDSLSSAVTLSPWKPVNISMNMMYTTNFSALLIGTAILPQNNPTAVTSGPPVYVNQATNLESSYLAYGAKASFAVTRHLTADVAADRREQTLLNNDIGSDTVSSGAGYSTALGKGQFAVHYGLSWYAASTQDQTALGHSASASYSRDLFGWHSSGDGNFSRLAQTAFANITSTGYGFGFNTGRRFDNGWNLTLSAHAARNMLDGVSNSDSRVKAFSAGLAMGRLSVSGSFTDSSGDALQLGNGAVPGPVPGPIILPGLVVLYSGRAVGFGAGYNPVRNLRITGSYSRSKYRTENVESSSDNLVERIDIRSEYKFRQLHFVAGYAHLTQGIGITFNNPATVNSFYVGISRHFDIF